MAHASTGVTVSATGPAQATVNTPTQMTASVTGSANTAVTWSIKGQTTPTGALGSISAAGIYTPPSTVPSSNWVGITATSQADPTKAATAWLQVWNQVPVITSATAVVNVAAKLSLDVIGSNFIPSSLLFLSGPQISGYSVTPTILGPNEMVFTLGYIPAAGSQLSLSVIDPNPGKTQSTTFNVQVPPRIAVTAAGSTQLTVGTPVTYTASVVGTPNTAVTWSVQGAGSITAGGVYTPPAVVPASNWVGITAASVVDPTKTSAVWAQISNNVPTITSATTTLGPHSTLLFDVIGTNFLSTSQLYFAGAQIASYGVNPVIVSPTEMTYTMSYPPKPGSALALSVINPNPGKTQSATYATIVPAAMSMALTGSSLVTVNATSQFSATVTGPKNTAVTWSVSGLTGVTQNFGSISSTGLYTAPPTVPASDYVHITATSQFDPTQSSSAWLQVMNLVPQITSAVSTKNGPTQIVVNITGSNFTPTSTVYMQATRLDTTYVSPTALVATINTPQTAGSQVPLSVVNPAPGKTISPNFNAALPGHVGVKVVGSAQVPAGTPAEFFSTVTGTSTTGVTWSVTSSNTDGLSDGTITSDGVYTPPASVSANRNVNIVATSQVDPTQSGTLPVTVVGTTTAAAARLLEQSTFGPTDALIGHVQQVGLSGFLDEQLATTPTLLPILPNPLPAGTSCVEIGTCNEVNWWADAITAPDQLRQRVAFTLGEMFVISNRESDNNTIAAYWNNLTNDAFGNWYTIMKDVTLSAGMGEYLNMVNSSKANTGSIPNENFARENLQLFNVGLNLLNQDATLQTDSLGNPIPAYTESQVQAFAKAFTGWTMNPVGGGQPTFGNWRGNFSAPMVAYESKHDTSSKQLLNSTLPAGQTTEQDLDGALTDVFNHPNVGPFVTAQLIRHLVKSNPSAQYVGRVAAVFNNDGTGVRGNMVAVIKAILLDEEARAGDVAQVENDGYLREPILWTANVLRALGAAPYVASSDNTAYVGIRGITRAQGEIIFNSPSVFNFFPTDWKVQGTGLAGPEFALETSATIMQKLTMANTIVDNLDGHLKIDLSATSPLGVLAATSDDALLDELNKLFLHGQMSSAMRSQISSTIDSISDPAQRVRMAVYLVIISSQYKLVH